MRRRQKEGVKQMRMIFQVSLALFALIFLPTIAKAADRIACLTRLQLETVIEQGVAIDKYGRAEKGCSLITEEFIRDYLQTSSVTLRQVFNPWCVEAVADCQVEIRAATYGNLSFCYEVGVIETSDPDAFEEAILLLHEFDRPVLKRELPNGEALPAVKEPRSLHAAAN